MTLEFQPVFNLFKVVAGRHNKLGRHPAMHGFGRMFDANGDPVFSTGLNFCPPVAKIGRKIPLTK
jgi:hypothetical protein